MTNREIATAVLLNCALKYLRNNAWREPTTDDICRAGVSAMYARLALDGIRALNGGADADMRMSDEVSEISAHLCTIETLGQNSEFWATENKVIRTSFWMVHEAVVPGCIERLEKLVKPIV